MRSSVVGVVVVALFGVVQSTPGILDLFNFDIGPPPVRTVYVVKPSHGHHHGGPPPSHGRSPKTIIKYVSKPPKSSHSISPFSIFSNAFSSMGGGGAGSGWSTLSHGKRTKPSSTRVVNEEMFNSLAQQDSDDENSLGEGQSPMNDGDGMNQMLTTSTRGNADFDSDDPNAEVEIVNVRPQTQQNMRGMRPPPTTSSGASVPSQGGYSSGGPQKTVAAPLRSGPRPRPTGRAPSSSQAAAPQRQRERPSSFDDHEGPSMIMNNPQSGPESDDDVEVSMPPRGRGASSSRPNRPSGNSKHRGRGTSSGSGWSSGPPKTITYITHGWGGPPPSSGGWGGWESSEPSSHGWPSSFEEDDYWPIEGGGSGWSSSSGGWSGSGGGWTPGPPPSPGGGTDETDPEEEMSPQPVTEGPVEMVEMVGSTEEGEDRRPPRPPSSSGRRPMQSSGGSSGRRPMSSRPRPTPVSEAAAPVSPSRRPNSSPARPTSSGPVRGAMLPPSTPAQSQPQQGVRQKRPRTNEPQPETEYLDVVTEVMPGSPRPQYGVPNSSGGVGNGLGTSSSSSSTGQQLMLGGQVISSQDGLLDEELIRTVQQIIQQFDKN